MKYDRLNYKRKLLNFHHSKNKTPIIKGVFTGRQNETLSQFNSSRISSRKEKPYSFLRGCGIIKTAFTRNQRCTSVVVRGIIHIVYYIYSGHS